jgi:hypothetical protein
LDSASPGDAAVNSQRLVLPDRALRVGDVEPIDLNPQLTTFTKLDRIVGAEIPIGSGPIQEVNYGPTKVPDLFRLAYYMSPMRRARSWKRGSS